MTRAFNIEGLVRLQNYMGGKTLSDAQFFAVLNADVVEMIDGEESTTKRRYFRIAENDESITFSCILGSPQQQMVVTKATKQLNVSTTSILSGQPGSITSERKPRIRPAIRKLRWRSRPLPTKKLYRNTLCHL